MYSKIRNLKIAKKLTLAFVVVVFISLAPSAFFVFHKESKLLELRLGKELERMARSAVLLIDPIDHQKVIDDYLKQKRGIEKTKHFLSIRKKLQQFQNEAELSSEVYTLMRPKWEPNTMVFVSMGGEKTYVGNGLPINPTAKSVFETGIPAHTGLYKDEQGDWISGFAPIKDSAGKVSAILEVDYLATREFSAAKSELLNNIILAGVLGLLLSIVMGALIGNSITHPIQRLVGIIELLAKGDMDHADALKSNLGKDEIGSLSKNVYEMAQELKQTLEMNRRMVFFPLKNPGPVTQIDQKGIVKMANPSAYNLFGDGESIVGKRWLEICPSSTLDQIGRLANSGGFLELEHRVEKDRSTLTFLLQFRGISELKRVMIYGSDITRLKQVQSQLHQSEKLASIGELAAGVGHEINNPLAIAKGNLDSVLKELKSDSVNLDQIRKRSEQQSDALERIRKIVNGLRTYARSDGEQVEFMDVNEIINQSVQLVAAMYSKEGISIQTKLQPLDGTVSGNIGKLQQILVNLLSNAKDALEKSEEKKIIVSTRQSFDQAVIELTDTGSGMPEAVKEKIFDAFFTTKAVGKGTGMGLGITSRIVKEMNGSIIVRSKVNEGTTFQITFPLVEAPATERIEKTVIGEKNFSGDVLIVDDEEGIREILRDILEDFGFKVEEARDGDEGLEKVSAKRYDIVFTDMKMPKMSGSEFISAARELPNGDSIFLIVTGGVTTGYSKEKREQLYEIGDGYILKPFSEESIYSVIVKCLKVRDEKQAA